MNREKFGNLFWGLHYHFIYDKRRSLAIDVGGCAGTYSKMYSCLFDTVKLFEPNENWIDTLNRRVPENVEVINTGLWNIETTLQFQPVNKTNGEPRGLSTFKQSAIDDLKNRDTDYALGQPVHLNVRTLDSYNLSDVSFVKIDTEGSEVEIVKGMLDTIQKCRPTLQIEIFPGNYKKILDLLQDISYTDIHAFNNYDMFDNVFLPTEKVS